MDMKGKERIARELGKMAVPMDSIAPDPANARLHPDENLDAIRGSLSAFGQQRPLVVDERGVILAGNGLYRAARQLGWKRIAVVRTTLAGSQGTAYSIADNRTAELAEWDWEALAAQLRQLQGEELDMEALGFSAEELAELLGGEGAEIPGWRTLAERFLVPPFSVLDARQGYWQKRKDEWLALGIEGELGREGANLCFAPSAQPIATYKQKERYQKSLGHAVSWKAFLDKHPDAYRQSGTSVFDPVLCELIIRWFCPKGGTVLDPFAGGSVRGVVASRLGRKYVGIELRHEQIGANRQQAKRLCADPAPKWIEGDGLGIKKLARGVEADLVFSCPPYADLERYSDDPKDLSTMGYPEFRLAYGKIIAAACAMLRANRFACFVVGDLRDKAGFYRGLPRHTIEAFEASGLRPYNDAIYVTQIGSLAIRAAEGFSKSRKLGKTHQNVLVFVKGSPGKAVAALGEVEVAEIQQGGGIAGDAGKA